MKTPLLLVACVVTFTGLGRLVAEPGTAVDLPDDQIETLVAPIALYPDPLVALILPATTHPSDVVLAARFLASGGSPENVLSEPWDESVKALVRYREVVEYLDRNLDWTRRLGDCFLDQRDDVMDAIQAVRARARAAGMLTDSPQQEIVVEDDEICIVPTNPTVIYVPRYDPVVLCGPVVTTTWYPRTWITFGVAYSVGPWLRYDCDWRARHVRVAHRPPSWYYQPDWRRHHRGADVTWSRWTPPSPRERERHRDRDFDRRGPAPERGWIGANETIARPERNRSSDWDRRPHTERDRRPRPDFNPRPRRETTERVGTAPGVVASASAAPTAPAVVSQSPFPASPAPAPVFSENRHRPRRDDDGPRPHRPPRPEVRPGTPPPPMVNPAPMTSSPVGPAVQPPPPMDRAPTDQASRPSSRRDDRRNHDRGRGDRGRDRQQQN